MVVDELDAAGVFVLSEAVPDEPPDPLPERVGVERVLNRLDERLDRLAVSLVRDADHAGLFDSETLGDCLLDLRRPDPVAAGEDHVVGPRDEPEVAVRVPLDDVVGEVPPVLGPLGRRFLRETLVLVGGLKREFPGLAGR